jgi:hypothetical protein
MRDIIGLAIDIVKDHPNASDKRLVRRWMAKVEEDKELLAAALEHQGQHAITLARRYWARRMGKSDEARAQAQRRKQEMEARVAKSVAKMRAVIGTDKMAQLQQAFSDVMKEMKDAEQGHDQEV